jgi:hypothetical protein
MEFKWFNPNKNKGENNMFYKFTFDNDDIEIIHKALNLYFKTINDDDNLIERNRIRGLCQTINSLDKTEYFWLTFPEACKKWGLSESTLRRANHDKRFLDGEVEKKGRDWHVTETAMKRLYGENKDGDTSLEYIAQ